MLRDIDKDNFERKPEEVFLVNIQNKPVVLRVIKVLGLNNKDCGLCYFNNPKTNSITCYNFDIPLGLCSGKDRSDNQDVAFMEVKNPPY